jgi:hypothetical protein
MSTSLFRFPSFFKEVYNVPMNIYRPILIVVGVVSVEKHLICKISDFAGEDNYPT